MIIADYKVVSEDYLPTLEKEVNKLISEGWEPIGGISVSILDEGCWWNQAMIKEKCAVTMMPMETDSDGNINIQK